MRRVVGVIATFTMLNLFIAIIVDAMQSHSDEERSLATLATDQAREEIGGLRKNGGEAAAKVANT